LAKPPSEFSKAQKQQFVSLVTQGGQVADGLKNRINEAAYLLMVECERTVIAVAALKNPKRTYQLSVVI
jgi:hypothetical protein